MTQVGTLQGFRAYMLQQHGIHADDEALEFALRRARSYSGSEAGVYTVASRWVLQAAEAQNDERGALLKRTPRRPCLDLTRARD